MSENSAFLVRTVIRDGGVPRVSTVITAALEGGIRIIVLADADDQQLAIINIALTAA